MGKRKRQGCDAEQQVKAGRKDSEEEDAKRCNAGLMKVTSSCCIS